MIVLDIAQHCHILSMQCCVQYWLSAGPEANCTHCTRILHEFHFIVSTAQNCTKSFKIQFSHGTGIKFVVVWSSLQIMRPRRRSGSDLNLPVTVDGRSARRGRLSRSQTLLSCDGGPPARRRGPTASAAAESPRFKLARRRAAQHRHRGCDGGPPPPDSLDSQLSHESQKLGSLRRGRGQHLALIQAVSPGLVESEHTHCGCQ